jgi:allantoin racemase
MERRILWINPVGTSESDAEMRALFESEALPGTRVEVRSLRRGPHHVEFHYYGALVMLDTLHLLRAAEGEGFDAAVVGCFYDPGVKEARELLERMPVVFPAETCLYLAATMADRFSILVGRRKWIPAMREAVERYGLGGRLASFKTLDLGVRDFQRDRSETARRMTAAAERAVSEDGAEAIVLGCTMEFGFFRELQARLGVPVLDATVTPFKFAELKAELSQRYGWSASKIGGFQSPRREEIESWGLARQYPEVADAWDQPSRDSRPRDPEALSPAPGDRRGLRKGR